MKISSYQAAVLVNGKPVREYSHENAFYIEGRKGSEFELQFRNTSPQRVLVVPAVDGLSVMDGKPASEQSRGYIVGAYGTVVIPGWRLDDATVAKFTFQDRRKSYSEATGEGTENVGVIGFMVFEEQVLSVPAIQTVHHYWPYTQPRSWFDGWPYYPQRLFPGEPMYGRAAEVGLSADNQPTGIVPLGTGQATAETASLSFNAGTARSAGTTRSATASTTVNAEPEGSFSLGTGFGDQARHQTVTVDFERKTATPAATLVLYYDSRRNLERKGIEVVTEHVAVKEPSPNPFPAQRAGCTPPPGWNAGQ